MSLLDRSLRRVEEAGTGIDSIEMGLPKNLPEMHDTKVPATTHFNLKYSVSCTQPKCPHPPGLQQMLPGKEEKSGIMAQGCQDRTAQHMMPLSSPLQCQPEGRRVLPKKAS